jgi:hypothetical protein
MMNSPKPTAETCRGFGLSAEAVALVRDNESAREFVGRLADGELYEDAFRFVAHALAKRRAVWWGCMCVWEAHQGLLTPVDHDALGAAARWSLEPNERHRRQAEKDGRTAGAGSAAGVLALAAFWSGGSMTPANLPVVKPPDHLTATAVAGGVLLAASANPATLDQQSRQFVAFAEAAQNYRHLE